MPPPDAYEGKIIWTEMKTKVNGSPMSVLVNKEWGLLLLGNGVLPLDEYPVQRLESIQFGPQLAEE